MKKLIALTLCLALVLSFSFAVMAAPEILVNLGTAGSDNNGTQSIATTFDASTMTFVTTVTGVTDQATLLVFSGNTLTTDGANIQYIDQITVGTSTVFTYKLKVDPAANELFTIKVGGSNLANPLSQYVKPIAAATGYKISGVITTVSPADIIGDVDMDAALNATTAVTVQLQTNPNDDIYGELIGNPIEVDRVNGAYEFTGIANGSYALKIARLGYLTRFVKVVVADDNVIVVDKELFAGDFTVDMMINGDDSGDLFNAGSFETDMTMGEYLPQYDISPDGLINGDDAGLLWEDFETDITSYGEELGV